jgi:large subunit ribosomal protein L17
MRHRVAGRHLARTSAHHLAMRRNMAQSLFQHGEIRTTLAKAKEIRPFVERLITLARRNTLRSRQRVVSMLNDRAVIGSQEQEQYDAMSVAHRAKVLTARSGRRHRIGKVPAAYNKKKVPFVATSVVHQLIAKVAPRFKDRPGGYTRIIRLPQRRVGDDSDLAILQLVGEEAAPSKPSKARPSRRKQRTANRIRLLEGKEPIRARGRKSKGPAQGKKAEDAPTPPPADSSGSGDVDSA